MAGTEAEASKIDADFDRHAPPIEATQALRAAPEESPFGFDELFFSRTDPHGIIQSGNQVFRRVSGYSWDELVGKPHKIIRHPDTPRAVFWQLWRTIQAGAPIGAYVKNRARDGRHYWVFAIVSPIDDGYLSVRLKPSSQTFVQIQDEYAKLAQSEVQDRKGPAESAIALLARLQAAGHPSYESFMAVALSDEVRARAQHLGHPVDGRVLLFDQLLRLAAGLLLRAVEIAAAYRENAYIPLNLRVQASQLGRDGIVIGTISQNFKVIHDELSVAMTRFEQSAQSVSQAISQGLFLICTATLQSEICEIFAHEPSSGEFCTEGETLRLVQQQARCNAQAHDALVAISHQTRVFRTDCAEMRRLAASLEVTRIMGKVETAKVEVARTGLGDLLDELAGFQRALALGLRDLDRGNDEIIERTDALLAARGDD